MKSDIDYLIPLMKEKSRIKDVHEFHSLINVIFHDIESKYYDFLHSEMWDSLQEVFSEFLNPIKVNIGDRKIKVLDIGCGTGLSTQLLLNTNLGENIYDITFLDTSKKMLEKCQKRFQNLKIKVTFKEGDISMIHNSKFDLIIVNSVLHHIPDLSLFLSHLKTKIETGGYLFHAHDPNGKALQSEIYKQRLDEYQNVIKNKNNNFVSKIYIKLKRLLRRDITHDHIDEVNIKLINEGIITEKLTENEIFSVTDIHVEDLPYSTNKGIVINELKKILYDFELVNAHTYTFFGVMLSKLSVKKYVLKERQLFSDKDMFGRNIAALWKNNSL